MTCKCDLAAAGEVSPATAAEVPSEGAAVTVSGCYGGATGGYGGSAGLPTGGAQSGDVTPEPDFYYDYEVRGPAAAPGDEYYEYDEYDMYAAAAPLAAGPDAEAPISGDNEEERHFGDAPVSLGGASEEYYEPADYEAAAGPSSFTEEDAFETAAVSGSSPGPGAFRYRDSDRSYEGPCGGDLQGAYGDDVGTCGEAPAPQLTEAAVEPSPPEYDDVDAYVEFDYAGVLLLLHVLLL